MLKKLGTIASLGLLGLILVVGTAAWPADAADHLDAPGLTPPDGERRVDITDVYVFPSPERAGYTVLAMGIESGSGANLLNPPGEELFFKPDAKYYFEIDTDGDAEADISFRARFQSEPDEDGRQEMELRRRNRGSGSSNKVEIIDDDDGLTTALYEAPIINEGEFGVRAFAGARDDPFFFDLPGFLNIDFCTPGETRPDTFAGTNVAYLVVEVPDYLLTRDGDDGEQDEDPTGQTVYIWGVTRNRGRADRMGLPAINTVFIPNNPFEPAGTEPSQKDDYNTSKPDDDVEDFRDEIIDTLEIFYGAGNAPDFLVDLVNPDMIPYTIGAAGVLGAPPGVFPNGRGLADDVIDTELGLVTNGAVTTDCVDGNDKAFSSAFPYLADPH